MNIPQPRTRLDWLEWAAAGAILVVALLEVFDQVPGEHWYAPLPVSVAFVILTVLPLATMRALPVASIVVSALSFAVYMAIWGQPSSSAAVFIIILLGFGWGRYQGPHRLVTAAAMTAMILAGGLRGDDPRTDLIFVVGITFVAFGAGRLVARYQRLAEQLRAQQPLVARAAVIDERTRIARELHDVVAHGVSVMVIQSVAGRTLLRRDPDQAEEALTVVEATGKDALAELRRLLGVLRADEGDTDVGVRPQPGLGDLDRLVASVKESGLDVDLQVSGDNGALTPGVDLAAYRIVQEALTNVIRHAGTGTATVRVQREPRALTIEVLDDGNGKSANGRAPIEGGGHGLPGMRERAALYGGRLEAGPRESGGYAVRAQLPLEATG
jgi:signal transduction histidine kinase